MTQNDIDNLTCQIKDYERISDIHKSSVLINIRETLDKIKDFILPRDQALYDTLLRRIENIINPPPTPVPIYQTINQELINPLLLQLEAALNE